MLHVVIPRSHPIFFLAYPPPSRFPGPSWEGKAWGVSFDKTNIQAAQVSRLNTVDPRSVQVMIESSIVARRNPITARQASSASIATPAQLQDPFTALPPVW